MNFGYVVGYTQEDILLNLLASAQKIALQHLMIGVNTENKNT